MQYAGRFSHFGLFYDQVTMQLSCIRSSYVRLLLGELLNFLSRTGVRSGNDKAPSLFSLNYLLLYG